MMMKKIEYDNGLYRRNVVSASISPEGLAYKNYSIFARKNNFYFQNFLLD